MKNKLLLVLLALILACMVSSITHADDTLVVQAKLLNARDFDKNLPALPIVEWLQLYIPTSYTVVWGEHITDCGESTGTAADKVRDMPLCAEVEIKKDTKIIGYLALFVATQNRGLLTENMGLYYGYLEHNGTKHHFRQLSDLRKVK